MSIILERVNAKTWLFEQVSDQIFANVLNGKVVRGVSTDKSSANWRTVIKFSDGSGVAVDEDRGKGTVYVRYLRSEAEQTRDNKYR